LTNLVGGKQLVGSCHIKLAGHQTASASTVAPVRTRSMAEHVAFTRSIPNKQVVAILALRDRAKAVERLVDKSRVG
jgi:hypothetical protein